jgi:serine/threonine-protein kinase
MIRKEYRGKTEHGLRFQVEVKAAARLTDAGIIRVYEVSPDPDFAWFSMEYCASEKSLEHHLRDGPMPAEKAAPLIEKIARSVHVAHRQGVIHRDLKPSNILMTSKEEPKVSDFGLACVDELQLDLTQDGRPVGTPQYIASESLRRKTRDSTPSMDLFALGVILYQTLTGSLPFSADNQIELADKVLNENVTPPRVRNPQVSEGLSTICTRCLQKKPDNSLLVAGNHLTFPSGTSAAEKPSRRITLVIQMR